MSTQNDDGGPAKRIQLEIRTDAFYAKWNVTPENLTKFLAFACECILESDRDEAARKRGGEK